MWSNIATQTDVTSNIISGAPSGSVIYFPSPNIPPDDPNYAGPYFYHISGRICDLTESKSWMTLAGDGPDSSVIKLTDATHKPTLPNESIIRVVGGTNPARGFSIRELTLNGTDRESRR